MKPELDGFVEEETGRGIEVAIAGLEEPGRPMRWKRAVRFLAGDVVIEPGIEPDGVYVVTAGMFEVGARPDDAAAPGPGERALPPRKMGPGEHFGMPLNGAATSPGEWVRASEDSTAYFVGKDDLQRLAMVSALIEPKPDTSSRQRR